MIHRMFTFILVTVLMISPFSSVGAMTDGPPSAVEESLYMFQTTEPTILYSLNEEPVGELLEGTTFWGQWDDSRIIVESEYFVLPEKVEPIESTDEPAFTDDVQQLEIPYGTIVSENNETILSFTQPIMVNVLLETDQYYEVEFAGITGFILKEEVEATENTSTESQDNQSNEMTDATTAETEETTSDSVNKTNETEKVTDESVTVESAPVTFASTDKYFRVNVENVVVYDNSTGKLVPVGVLYEGQVYERIKDLGNWHQIRFGNGYGYVYEPSTVPAEKSEVPNLNNAPNGERTFVSSTAVNVFDNSTGSLVKFATIQPGVSYPIVGVAGNWYKVNVSGRLGYVYSGSVQLNYLSSDRYFTPLIDQLGIYDNSSGKLVKVAELVKGEAYPFRKISGNWLEVYFGNKIGYVYKGNTEPTTRVPTQTTSTGSELLTTIVETGVYDNSTGKLVKFVTLPKGVTLTYISKMGNWYRVNIAGRVGYLHDSAIKRPFKSTDRYFEVYEDNVYVYDNSAGYLKKVALLEKGQTYERVRDIGNWHQIEFGDGHGYVWKESTKPSSASKVANLDTLNLQNKDISFLVKEEVKVYDNTGGKLVPFATLLTNTYYPVLADGGSWWKVSLGNRIGYVYKGHVIAGPIITYTKYDVTLEQMVDIQMTKNPQTDLYRNNPAYVHKNYINLNGTSFPTTGVVTASVLNVREGAGTNYWIVGQLKQGQTVQVLAQKGDWLQIKFTTWRNAKPEDVKRYLDPYNYVKGSAEYFQFLVLSQNAGISADELNEKVLINKGILSGKGQAFVEASLKHSINEMYLISHALLETGNGTSTLANGVLVTSVDGKPVEPKVVYNMYGIGAYDSCALKCGAETAYKNGWFTPEAAIIGGAEFIAKSYINNPNYQQNTLYKMRWNPANPGVHQYATDIGWAVKQVFNIKKLYDLIDHYILYFDIPVYKS